MGDMLGSCHLASPHMRCKTLVWLVCYEVREGKARSASMASNIKQVACVDNLDGQMLRKNYLSASA